MPTITQICAALLELQNRRRFCIRQQSKADRSIESFLARRIGYHSGLEEAERKRLFKRAAAMRIAMEKEIAVANTDDDAVARKYAGMIIRSANGRRGWDEDRDAAEKHMRTLAKQLPVANFVAKIPGFGELGLAVLVGEAGNLADYPNPAKLWKRLGLAVLGGMRQGNPGPNPTKEDWIAHGYNRQRRAEIWAFCSEYMFRHQWRKGEPAAKYGQKYACKKAEYLAREWTPKHADNAARRYMTKALIRDIWAEWNGVPIDEGRIAAE